MANTIPIHALSAVQWGLEANTAPTAISGPSAAVAATKKVGVKDFLIRVSDELMREDILKGLAISNRGNEVVSFRGVEWEVPESPVYFDELHYWIGMALVRPTKTGAGPFVWTGTLVPTAVQSRDMRTIEFGMGSHVSPGDNSDWEVPACFVKEIEFTGAANGYTMMSLRGEGRRLQPSTRTPALSFFPTVAAPVSLSSVRIDSTWAGIGTTAIVGQVIGWRWKFFTGLFSQFTTDGRADQDYNMVLFNPEECKWECEIDVKAALNTGQWQTEKTAAEANTLRAVEIRLDGPSANFQAKLQGLFKHTKASVFPDGRQDGEITAKLSLEGSTDDTNALAMIVTNNQTAAIA